MNSHVVPVEMEGGAGYAPEQSICQLYNVSPNGDYGFHEEAVCVREEEHEVSEGAVNQYLKHEVEL